MAHGIFPIEMEWKWKFNANVNGRWIVLDELNGFESVSIGHPFFRLALICSTQIFAR
jgi:hypothetical protein